MIAIIFGTVLPWLLVAFGGWFGYQLLRQNGRILLKLEAIEKQVGVRRPQQRPKPAGLKVGAAAPDFELPDLAGSRRKLSEFRGQDVLLMFFNPKCGFCTKMGADLAALPVDGGEGRAVPIVVTTGDVDENRKLVEKYGIRCLVLRQEQMEVASQFRAQGTPTGYRIDAAGHIASELAIGAEPLLKLAAPLALHQLAPPHGAARPSVNGHAKQPDPSLSRSRLNRSGLKAGTVAPDFTLPRINGGELSLTELRGRRVLLVFSDPNCGPCDQLAPQLQELYEERADLQVLMISRGDAAATRAKATALGLSFPIVMQKSWEVSLKYAKFATPIGYLIDEQGLIASDVAVGLGPILALAVETVPASRNAVSAEHALALAT